MLEERSLALYVELLRLEQEIHRGLGLVNEVLHEVLGAVVGLAVQSGVLEAHKVVLHACLHERAQVFDSLALTLDALRVRLAVLV